MNGKMVQMTFLDHDESYRINSRIEELEKEVTNCRRGLFARYARLECELIEMQKVMDRLLLREAK